MANFARNRFLPSILIAALLLGAAPLAAQTAGGSDEPSPQDQQAAPPPADAPAEALPQPSADADQTARAPVTVSSLGTADGAPVGLLDETNGGLGIDMWSGSSRAWLETELTRIPIVSADPVIRSLARKLLLTTSASPVGPAHRALVTIRIEKAMEGGLIDEAGALAAAADVPNDADFARVRAEALLYADRASDVCSDKTGARLSDGDDFWLALRAYCYAAGGDMAALDLTRAVIDAKGARDSAFGALLDATLSKPPKAISSITKPTAIDIFLLRRLGWPVTAQIASQLGTSADLLALRDRRNAPTDRLESADGILSTGAASAAELRDIADAQAYTSAQLNRASENASPLSFLGRQALLRQAAGIEGRAIAKAALIESADPTLNVRGPFFVFAALQARNAKAVPADAIPDRKSDWILARCLILGGDPDAALPLLQDPDNPLLAEAGLALDIARPSPEHDALAQTALSWLATHASLPDGWPAATYLALGLANVLGLPLAPEALNATDTLAVQNFDGEELDRDVLADIDAAAAAPDRRGEAVLRIINAIGTTGPARLAPDAAVHVIGELRQLGFSQEARALAVEDLLLGPPPPSHAPEPAERPAAP
jgi:hypothetical protein